MKITLYRAFLSLSWILVSGNLAASGFIESYSTNVQFLHGSDYKLGAQRRNIVTLEHANQWRYGDFHFFNDYTWPSGDSSFYYFEPTLRFSLGKLTGKPWSYGVIKDVLISSNFEKPKGRSVRRLGGVALDFSLPGFKYFKSNYWVRDNPELAGDTYQITLAWSRPFKLANVQCVLEGFADFAGPEGGTSANQLIVPRLLVNAGDLLHPGFRNLWVGLEYSYWRNKFGVAGVTEANPQFQVKWVF